MSLLTAQLKRLQSKQGIKFKSGFLNLGAKKVMTSETFALMRNEEGVWKLNNKIYSFQAQKWQKVFEFLTDCQVQTLLLDQNNRQSILREIKLPNYVKLKVLTLNKNNLVSIQVLCLMNFPNLSQLDISMNNIVFVHSLCHLTIPLTTLKLNGNPIADVQKLQRASFVHLKELHLQDKSKDVVVGDNLSWLLKFPSSRLGLLHCASRKRFRQEVIWRQLGQRYPAGRILLK